MLKVFFVLILSSMVCVAGSDLPPLTIFSQPPELSEHSDNSVTETESNLLETPELTCPRPSKNSVEYTATPRQELPNIDEIALSTSDRPDSDDSFFVQSSPRVFFGRDKGLVSKR